MHLVREIILADVAVLLVVSFSLDSGKIDFCIKIASSIVHFIEIHLTIDILQ